MVKKFTKNFLKIYFWQFFSICISILSSLIVIPKLTSDKITYGIYSTCTSLLLYIFYLDFGFLSSSSKYANDFFVKKNKKKEIEVEAFGIFIFNIFLLIFFLIILFFLYNPNIFIKNLNSSSIFITKKILKITLFSIFISIFYKFINLILEIRLENYIFFKFYSIGNLIKLLSSFYFFKNSKNDIIGYYTFYTGIDFLVYIICLIIIKIKYKYDYLLFLKSFHFSKKWFKVLKSLSFPGFLNLILNLITFEMSSFFIIKFFGIICASYYNASIVIYKFIFQLTSMLTLPIFHRMNYFYAKKDFENIKIFLLNTINLFMPIIVFPSISIIIFSKPLIYAWLGKKYFLSSINLIFLILSIIFLFINILSEQILLIFKENEKRLFLQCSYLVNYILFFLIFIRPLNFLSFSLAKCFASNIMIFINIFFLLKILKCSFKTFFNYSIKGMIFPTFFVIIFLILFKQFIFFGNINKNLKLVIYLIFIGSFSSFIGTIFYFFTQKSFNEYIKNFIHRKKNEI